MKGVMDIVFYEIFEEEEKAVRAFLPPSIKAAFKKETVQAAGDVKAPAPLISTRTQSIIPPTWAEDLQGILTRSTGFDHLKNFTGKIECGYLPEYCVRSVAEHAVMLIFGLLKGIRKQLEQFANFNRDGLTGREVTGRRLLVIGVGRIGEEIAKLGKAFGMHVKGVDVDPRLKDFNYVPLEEGLAWADVIVCSAALTDSTRGLLNYAKLAKAPRGAVLINISRGEITPAADMIRLLNEGILGGAGFDVFEDENRFADELRSGVTTQPHTKSILEMSARLNVLCTPHNAFNTQEALQRKAEQTAVSVVHFLEKKKFLFSLPK